MTERRFKKLELLMDGHYEAENTDSSIALLPWGCSKGPTYAAFQSLRSKGEDIAWYYTMYLNPLPTALLDELLSKDLVLVPELSYLGQLAQILRAKGIKAEPITQYMGLPFKENVLEARITEIVQERAGRMLVS